MASSARLGDAAHTFILANTIAFMAAVIMQALGVVDCFAASWSADGFCIAHKEDTVDLFGFLMPLSSHALCFYSDTAFALLLFLLSRHQKNEPSMKPVADAAPGILGHGAAHLGLWSLGEPSSNGPPIFAPHHSLATLAALVAGVSVFFYLLFRTFSLSTRAIVVQSIIHGAATALVVPPRFGFTYVQTALMLIYSVAELWRPLSEKDAYYAAYALMVGVPVGFVGWIESLGCDAFIRSVGGHVVYDTSISLSICAYYFIARGKLLDSEPKSGKFA